MIDLPREPTRARAAPSGPPAQEIGDQPQPRRLALLRVELGPDQVVPRHRRRHRPAVVGPAPAPPPDRPRRDGRNARNRRDRPSRSRRAPDAAAGSRARSSPCAGSSGRGRRASIRTTSPRDPAEARRLADARSPRLAIICMPTQIPRNGAPSAIARRSIASNSPARAISPARQSAKAPTPGSTIRSARRHDLRVAADHDRRRRRSRAPSAGSSSRPNAGCRSRSRR